MSEKFPIDLMSVKEYGIKKWYSECSEWPVRPDEVKKFKYDLHNAYIKLIKDSDKDISDCLLIMYKIVLKYESLFLKILEIRRKEKTCEVISSKGSQLAHNICKNLDVKKDIYQYLTSGFLLRETTIKQKFIRKLKTLIIGLRWSFNNITSILKASGCYFSVQGLPGKDLENFAKSKNKRISVIYPRTVLTFNKSNNLDLKKSSKLKAGIIKMLSDVLSDYKIEIDKRYIKLIADATVSAVGIVSAELKDIESYLRKRKPVPILLTSLGMMLPRMVAVAGMRQGYEIVGAVHGENAGNHLSYTVWAIDLTIVNLYLTPSNGATKEYLALLDKMPILNGKKPKIISINKYGNSKLSTGSVTGNSKLPKKILIVEYPLTDKDVIPNIISLLAVSVRVNASYWNYS